MPCFSASILTLYPEMFPGILGYSLSGEALSKDLWHYEAHNIRDFGAGRHRMVDDSPAGGGAGMVLRCDIVAEAFDAHIMPDDPRERLYMSPRGKPLTQDRVRALSQSPGVIILCGRFEGVDQRVLDSRNFEEVSIGDYILSGGEIAAQVLLDACIRLIPGVMGKHASADEESFETGLLEYPHYTRPREWEDRLIPDVLLSGNHAEIRRWRQQQAEELTEERRPDLWQIYQQEKKRN